MKDFFGRVLKDRFNADAARPQKGVWHSFVSNRDDCTGVRLGKGGSATFRQIVLPPMQSRFFDVEAFRKVREFALPSMFLRAAPAVPVPASEQPVLRLPANDSGSAATRPAAPARARENLWKPYSFS